MEFNADNMVSHEQSVVIPETIDYIPTIKPVNDMAKVKLAIFFRSQFQKKRMSGLFGESMMCGPFLWSRLKDHAYMRYIEYVDIDFHEKSETIEGKVILGRSSIEIFLIVLFETLPVQDQNRIRKLSASEIRMYWSMVPYTIKEPVFIVEIGVFKLLVNFTQNLKIGFMGELSTMDVSQSGPDDF